MKKDDDIEALKIEDLRIITLLEKKSPFHADLHEILTYSAVLKIVIGDLQGLPEVFLTRAPNAQDVCFPLLSFPYLSSTFLSSDFLFFSLVGVWLLQDALLRVENFSSDSSWWASDP